MPKHPELARALKEWWRAQDRWSSKSGFARSTGVGLAAIKSYFAGRYRPSGRNRAALFRATELAILKTDEVVAAAPAARPPIRLAAGDAGAKRKVRYALASLLRLETELGRALAALSPAADALATPITPRDWDTIAQTVVALMDSIERRLNFFVDNPAALQALRRRLNGPDAGYLAGLLSSILDDERLARWKEMTTYRYGTRCR